MAEGGNEKHQNPFSFQNFVKASSKSETKLDIPLEKDTRNESFFIGPDLGAPRRKETSKLIIVDEEKTSKREENPFSLKQFLKKDVGTKPKNKGKISIVEANGFTRHPLVTGSGDGCRSGSVTNSPKLPDFASGLPDFVQDHFFLEHTLHDTSPSSETKPLDSELLPDFTLSVPASVESHYTCNGANGNVSPPTTPELQNTKVKSRTAGVKSLCGENGHISSSLPDFLSDGPMLSNHVEHQTSSNNYSSLSYKVEDSSFNSGDVLTEVAKLREENAALRQTLQDSTENRSLCSKIRELQEEIQTLKAKEAEEMNALEKVVQQVESNLQNTLHRALTAEATVDKLRQEVKTLQMKIAVLTEGKTIPSGGIRLVRMRDKVNSTSQQITAAASSAEQTLQQLLSGVEVVKLLASCLHNIDQITEEDSGDISEEKT